jgi:hypothetical protein
MGGEGGAGGGEGGGGEETKPAAQNPLSLLTIDTSGLTVRRRPTENVSIIKPFIDSCTHRSNIKIILPQV